MQHPEELKQSILLTGKVASFRLVQNITIEYIKETQNIGDRPIIKFGTYSLILSNINAE